MFDRLPKEYLEDDYFSLKTPIQEDGGWAKWVGQIFGSREINSLYLFVRDVLYLYWTKYNSAIDYTMFFWIITVAYNDIKVIKENMDLLKPNIQDVSRCLFYIENFINEKYTPELYEEIKKESIFQYYTYRKPYKAYTENGELTIYGKMLKDEGMEIKDYNKK